MSEGRRGEGRGRPGEGERKRERREGGTEEERREREGGCKKIYITANWGRGKFSVYNSYLL